jgi:hypothetical protein
MVSKPSENQNEFYSDGIELVRRVMEDTFILLFFEAQAHHRIGFTKISRLISQEPGWYLWTKQRKGAYLLELIDIEDFHKEPRLADMPNLTIHPAVRAEFMVRYYPSPEEPSFNDFAFIERETRLGPSFDHTGTPFFEKQNEIHESLFTVGKFHLSFDNGLDFASLNISSQDRWIETVKNGPLAKTDDRQGSEVVSGEVKARNVPGWELSWYLFDKLLLSFCYVHKAIPFGLGLTEHPGTIYHRDEFNQVVGVHEPDVRGRTIEAGVLLQSAKRLPIDPGALKETFLQSIRLSLKKDEVLVGYFENPPEEERPWINPDWWRASSWSFPPAREIKHRCFTDD